MRRFLALAGMAALLSIAPATPALADGSIGEDGICIAGVPDGNGGFIGPVEGTSFSRTTKSGITNYTCHFDLDELAPPKNRKASGFPCLTPAGIADESRLNASPGGRMTMNCTVRP